jgi:uncharacterized peroxidase-related enzyme
MARLAVPTDIDSAPTASRPLLSTVNERLGMVPNLFRLVGNSPAALDGYVGLMDALGRGSLPLATRQRIALAVAEVNACSYCLSAHTYLGKNVAKLSDAEMGANRRGTSLEPKANAAVHFAAKVTRDRGDITTEDVDTLRSAGYDDAQIVEIVFHVALNVWTNYLNKIAGTEIDFPVVLARSAA